MTMVELRTEGKRSYLSPRGTQALVISIVFTSLATLLVTARVYTRTKLIKRIEANDWTIIIALILSFIFMSSFILEALNGMGMHLVDIPKPIYNEQMKAFWLTIPFYNAALLCAKASILMQYFRVFPSRRMRHICWVMIALLAIYGTWAVSSGFLNCIPVAKFWDPSIPGSCISMKGLWFSNASMHIATDLAILVIPIPALAALELSMKQRVVLISIFALDGFVCVTSICRLLSLKKISDSSDPTYDNVGAATWSAIECNVGIICACLPTLRPLVSRIIPQLLSSLTASRHHHNAHNHFNLKSRSKNLSRSLGRGHGHVPLHEISPPSYWGVAGSNGGLRLGVETTIATHIDDLEYGTCEGDADRFLALKYGAGAGIIQPRMQARVHVGSDAGDERDEERREIVGGRSQNRSRGSAKGNIGDEEGTKIDGVFVRTEVRSDSSSSTSPFADGAAETASERK
ncbi:hypothetical protein BDV19DRAFT_380158 [Aspergillus venezuelensis]